MQEIYEIGRRAGANFIEVELYKQINSKIYFPSAGCAVNTYNTLDWAQIFRGYGFARDKVMYCFELNLDEFNGNDENDYPQIHIRRHISTDENDKKLYYKLWSLSDNFPYYFGNNVFWYSNVFGWPRVWYSDVAHILNKDDYILFAEKDGEIVGFIHWWPNLYPLLIEGGRKTIFGRESSINELIDKIGEAKIFKIITSKKARDYKNLIEKALIEEALKVMKGNFGFKKCQIGNIPVENDKLSSFIERKKGRRVHEIWIMRSKSLFRFG